MGATDSTCWGNTQMLWICLYQRGLLKGKMELKQVWSKLCVGQILNIVGIPTGCQVSPNQMLPQMPFEVEIQLKYKTNLSCFSKYISGISECGRAEEKTILVAACLILLYFENLLNKTKGRNWDCPAASASTFLFIMCFQNPHVTIHWQKNSVSLSLPVLVICTKYSEPANGK